MKKIYTLVFLLFLSFNLFGQLSISNFNTNFVIDFTTTVAGVNNGIYVGTGFTPTPAVGQLNSNAWAVTGWSNGNLLFGGTQETASTDYTRGTPAGSPTSNAVTTGGFYAFLINNNNTFGFQPGGSDFEPGTLTLRIQNTTGGEIKDLVISYNIFVRNDQTRSSLISFSHSSDDVTYTPISALDLASGLAADADGFVSNSRMTTINNVNIPNNSFYYIRWSHTANGGTGSRDEFALDEITVSGTDVALPITLTEFAARQLSKTIQLRWSTGSESNTDRFEILRSGNDNKFELVGTVAAAGFSSKPLDYTWVDEFPLSGLNYYKLRQVDLDGKAADFEPIVINADNRPSELISITQTDNTLQIGYYANQAGVTTIDIFDLSGRKVRSEEINVQQGFNTLQLIANDISTGMQFVRVRQGADQFVKKFVK